MIYSVTIEGVDMREAMALAEERMKKVIDE
jgi:hypothetical protein